MLSAPEVRERIGRPIIDSDGHLIEYLPLVRDLVAEEHGLGAAQRFDELIGGPDQLGRLPPETRRAIGAMRPPWWALAPDPLDRASAMLPHLLRSRLDELGLDFTFLYPTFGMAALHVPDAEFRGIAARAFNRHAVEVCDGVRDRIEPVAVVPAFTPAEALAALEHAVGELGLKAVVLTGLVPRSIPGSVMSPAAFHDGLGHGAAESYDPVWSACERLGIMPTFHTPAFGFGTRASPDSYVANHIGGFAAGAEAAARSLILGGVPSRFPSLRFLFLEGGAGWAVSLCRDLVGHWQRRAGDHLATYDPARLDRDLIARLLAEHGREAVRLRAGGLDATLDALGQPLGAVDVADEFSASGLGGPDAIRRVFSEQVFAGCEADDPLTRLAFDDRLGHDGRLGVVFASDLGHWDAPVGPQIVPELWEQVEHDQLTEDQVRALVWEHPVRAWAGDGLGPFRGTALEADVRRAQSIQGDGSKSIAR